MKKGHHHIDLNCDLGEGIAEDEKIIPLISSCNLACGGHAGDLGSLRHLLGLTLKHKVRAGAHPSYPDLTNFGRLSIPLEAKDLGDTLTEQLERFRQAAAETGATMHHIKAHGALYNDLARDAALRSLYLQILAPYQNEAILFVPAGSDMATVAREAGFRVWEEAFADRAYHKDGRLLSRQLEGSLLTEPEAVWQQVRRIVLEGQVNVREGGSIPIQAKTLCLHGDTPNALEILTYLRNQFNKNDIRIAS